jgi:hypothetical protein
VIAAFAAVLALASAPLDSQVVLERYASKLLATEAPKVLIFTYSVSQAGPSDIEQTHRIYRSGELVRDETLTVDGQPPRRKITRFARYRNRYTLENLAPRLTEYALLFQRATRNGNAWNYQYRAVPLGTSSGFVVDGLTIDGRSYLPVGIQFHTGNAAARGKGAIAFSRSGKYWVPTGVSIEAKVRGEPARERITFGGYQFPASLPKSTFQGPKPLPTPVAPTL